MLQRLGLGLLVLAAIAALAIHLFVPPFLKAGTGITAKQVCSLTFVTGLDPDRAWELYLEPILDPFAPLMRYKVDVSSGEVTASVLGFGWQSRAVHRNGLGCTLVHGDGSGFDRAASLEVLTPPFAPMALDPAARAEAFDETALAEAVEAAMKPGTDSLAVVVLHQGKLVAEAYAEGIGPQTPLHGWSMTKSAAATAAGVLAHRGLLDVEAPNAVPALKDQGRGDITVNDLLRMQAGLAIFEENTGFDPNSDMLFTESDMAQFGATRKKVTEPEATFDYQSGQTVLAGTAMRKALGGSPEAQMATLREWLFEPLGIRTAVIEPDQAGNFVWSSYMFASARDWARLGQLYLDDGVAPSGERLLPEGWRTYVSTATKANAGYGAGFWLSSNSAETEAIVMDGFQGQTAYVLPQHDLVIVRLAAEGGWSGVVRSVPRAVVAAKRSTVEPSPE